MLLMPLVVLSDKRLHVDYFQMDPHDLLNMIQYSDLAGLATIVSANPTNMTLGVDVKQWWLGSWPTNRFEIHNADVGHPGFEEYPDLKFPGYICELYDWNPLEKTGYDIVFFAMTNEFKQNSSMPPPHLTYDWNYAQTFTNSFYESPPSFMHTGAPTVFLLDENYDYYLNVLSNITYSIFITRDKMQFYRGLRDAWGVDGKSEMSYRLMARFPLRYMMHHETFPEGDYITMLNDQLLFPTYRTNALKRLIRDYNWSPTNTVPVP